MIRNMSMKEGIWSSSKNRLSLRRTLFQSIFRTSGRRKKISSR